MLSLFNTAIQFRFFSLLLHNSAVQNCLNATAEIPPTLGVTVSKGKRHIRFYIPDLDNFAGTDSKHDVSAVTGGNKTLDAFMGDTAIIVKRWDFKEFTVPYTNSRLHLVVPVKRAKPWVFFKPFTLGLWLATGGNFLYMMLVIWFLEHRCNSRISNLTSTTSSIGKRNGTRKRSKDRSLMAGKRALGKSQDKIKNKSKNKTLRRQSFARGR